MLTRNGSCTGLWTMPTAGTMWLLMAWLPLAHGQHLGGRAGCCPPACPAPCPAPATTPEQKPPDQAAPPPAVEPTIAPEQFAATEGGATFAAAAPNMIGDGAGACGKVLFEGQIIAEIDHPTFACGRYKIAENNSPLPRDRAYFIYQSFQAASGVSITSFDPLGATLSSSADVSINKYTLGVEKTFFDRWMSFQIQLPISNELTNNPFLNFDAGFGSPALPPTSTGGEIGNLAMALKARLWQTERFVFAGGSLLHVPTAPDVQVRAFSTNDPDDDIDHRYTYHNQATIISPFVGFLATPRERLFFQGFMEVDVDLGGNGFDFDPIVDGVALARQSFRLREQTLMRVDLGTGYWLYRNPDARFLTGVANSVEVHWTGTLNDAQVLSIPEPAFGATVFIGNTANRVDIVNLTVGPTLEFVNRSTLGVGFVAPLRTGDNRGFDWELNLQLNYRFGYQDRLTSTPNL